MSQLLIQNYFAELDRVKRFSGSLTERVISEAFKDLLKSWSKQQGLQFLSEYDFQSPQKNTIRPDGTIMHDIRIAHGYWEAKDTADDLDAEIRKKLAKGYPQSNIIFENSHTAVLIQNRQEVVRANMREPKELAHLVQLFFSYERQEVAEFRKAVEQFRQDLPQVLEALRAQIAAAYTNNSAFHSAADGFLAHARDTINPAVSEADVREMLIQHILTEEIFAHVFDQGDFHRENNIAKELYALESKFFTGQIKRETLKSLEPYYATIRANAVLITSHNEKQTFLKVIYENFYKVYDRKKADRLGVVYTPNEIVKFMIDGADWLCEKHFGKNLIDEYVEILDPATGTGTFICELLEHFRGHPKKLAHKYKNELHANEVAILPYYVANLNIEATYAAISGQYAEFPNLCFVDTLDNVAGLGIRAGYQHDMFAGLSDENVARVKRQNARKISVVIGNPPYNANQANENDNNKNREYPRVDELIKSSYIRLSTAQKTKVYDMYARFFRWASDRMADDGVLAFITNRSFIDSRTFDGFRKAVMKEFNEIHVVDLGGDVRANPKLSGTKNNVFGIQTGVAISFLVKRHKQKGCKIFYARRPEMDTAEDKLAFLGSAKLSTIRFERVEPDKNANWINLTENNWDDLIPVADKKTKGAKTTGQERAIFKLFSFGLVTNRDDWIYDRAIGSLEKKIEFLITSYEKDRKSLRRTREGMLDVSELGNEIKWTRSVKQSLSKDKPIVDLKGNYLTSLYRPFDRQKLYFFPPLIEMMNQTRSIFGEFGSDQNSVIAFSDPTSQKPFMAMGSENIVDMHLVGAAAGSVCLPRYRYTPSGEKIDNITDWALKEFRKAYAGVISPLEGVEERVRESERNRSSESISATTVTKQQRKTVHDLEVRSEIEEGAHPPLSPLVTSPPQGGRSTGRKLSSTRTEEGRSEPYDLASPKPEKGRSKTREITKDDIFQYVYAVLHDPLYREKYAINLKREFPRIPFYADFQQWADWGRQLLDLHITYETVTPYALVRSDMADEKARAAGLSPKLVLKSDPDNGMIRLDTETTLSGIPKEVWSYRLGNRSALDWILDQYKEKTPKDPTIREKFNTYRFADYKEQVVDLIARVTQVSVETVRIVEAMRAARR